MEVLQIVALLSLKIERKCFETLETFLNEEVGRFAMTLMRISVGITERRSRLVGGIVMLAIIVPGSVKAILRNEIEC